MKIAERMETIWQQLPSVFNIWNTTRWKSGVLLTFSSVGVPGYNNILVRYSLVYSLLRPYTIVVR